MQFFKTRPRPINKITRQVQGKTHDFHDKTKTKTKVIRQTRETVVVYVLNFGIQFVKCGFCEYIKYILTLNLFLIDVGPLMQSDKQFNINI